MADNRNPQQPGAPAGANQQQSYFCELMSELNKLHATIDVGKMLRLVKELNRQLATATSELEKFNVFISFKPGDYE